MVSVIIPAYNEGLRLRSTIEALYKHMKRNYSHFEIIIVDDGSKDGTLDIALDFKQKEIEIVSFSTNKGKGAAIREGMIRAKGSYVFFTDADMSYSFDNIEKAIKLFERTGADIIIGQRSPKRKGYPFSRKLMSQIFGIVINFMLRLKTEDVQCGFKGFTNEGAKQLFTTSRLCRFGIDFEILYLAKKCEMEVQALPVTLKHNKYSKVDVIFDSLQMIKDACMVLYYDWSGAYKCELACESEKWIP